MAFGQANAQMPTKMIGHAWAPNWGWLNFGSGGTQAYPTTTINQTTGAFSGYAWSTNLGWIKIDPTLTGPALKGDNFGVKAVASTTKTGWYDIKGWMRACSVYVNPALCSGAEKLVSGNERGDWDGWFKMKDVVYNPNTLAYTGNAWGDLVGGWVNFGATSQTPPVGCVGAACNACDPTKTTCNVCVGAGCGTNYSCLADKDSGPVPLTVTWSASPLGLTYIWSESTDDQAYTPTDLLVKTYSSIGNIYRRVTFKNAGGNILASDIQCKTSAGKRSVTVTSDICKLVVNMTGTTTAVVNYNGSSGVCTFDAPSNTRSCKYESETCPAQSAISVAAVNSWNGCNSGSDLKNCKLSAILPTAPKTVTANFGGGGKIIIGGGLGTNGNLVRVDKPSSYPTNSTPLARISTDSLAGDSVSVSSWGGIIGAMDGSSSCSNPSLCIGGSCIEAGSTETLSVSNTPQTLKLSFPSKCPNSKGISVFHKPAGYWNITLTPTSGGADKTLILYFNDPNSSNQ